MFIRTICTARECSKAGTRARRALFRGPRGHGAGAARPPGVFRGPAITRLLLLVLAILSLSLRASHAAKPDDLTGKLLVASRDMKDPRFSETVIYIIAHSAQGAFGLVINRPVANAPVEDLLKGFGAETTGATGEVLVHYGGPVSPRQAFILHTEDVLLATSTRVKDGIAMTADAKLLREMGRGKGPREALLMFGYAGWAPGQLESEIKADSWITVPAEAAVVFGKDPEKKWRQAIDKRQIPL